MRRRLIQLAASWYPSAWRKRYGQELNALIEDMPAPGWAAVWDVWKGAIAMQVKNRWNIQKIAAFFGLVGLALAWGASLRIRDIYVSESVLLTANLEPKSIGQSVRQVLSRARLQALIEKHGLYAEERTRLPLEDIIEKLKKNIHVNAVLDDNGQAKRAIRVGFADEDRALAQRVTGDLVEALVKESPGKSLTILDSASSPEPIYPNRPVFAFIGLVAGGMMGAALAVWKMRIA